MHHHHFKNQTNDDDNKSSHRPDLPQEETSSIHQQQDQHAEDMTSQKDTLTNTCFIPATDYDIIQMDEMQRPGDAQNTHSMHACDAKLQKIIDSLILYLHENRDSIELLHEKGSLGACMPTTTTTTTTSEPSISTHIVTEKNSWINSSMLHMPHPRTNMCIPLRMLLLTKCQLTCAFMARHML
nr:unnamed protein product [Naegleria fowleri]